MLTAYFDESGTDGRSPIVAVGGYVSTQPRWDDFQRDWKRLLDEEQIRVFHTTDLLSLRGEFTSANGWNRARAMDVLNRADDIIEKHVMFGIVAYTHIADCETVYPLKDASGTRKKYSYEYVLAGTQAIIGVGSWALENGYTEPIQYVFEDGASGRGSLVDGTNIVRKTDEGKEKFLIGGISLGNKRTSPQLHSADKLVQQSCRAIAGYIQGRGTEESAINRLIKAKLGKVYRFDNENLPLLHAISTQHG